MRTNLIAGLYLVETTYFVAGFVVEHWMITRCAPILRKNLKFWQTIAKRISD